MIIFHVWLNFKDLINVFQYTMQIDQDPFAGLLKNPAWSDPKPHHRSS